MFYAGKLWRYFMEKALEAVSISKKYKSHNVIVNALKETSLTVHKGEIAVIIGKSGSGKSTLLNVLGGLIKPDSGKVLISNKSIYDISEKERANIRNTRCGFVYQSFNLLNELNVINNIRLPFDIAGKPYNVEKEKELITILGLSKREHFFPEQLSGGERQRVAIARSLLMEPSIILADEPTGNLDVNSGKALMNLIVDSNKNRNQTYIIVTHDLEWLKVAHTVYRMSDGILKPEV